MTNRIDMREREKKTERYIQKEEKIRAPDGENEKVQVIFTYLSLIV